MYENELFFMTNINDELIMILMSLERNRTLLQMEIMFRKS